MTEQQPTQIRLIFTQSRETKNTVVFEEATAPGTDPHVKTLYLKKKSWELLGKPQEVAVEVTAL